MSSHCNMPLNPQNGEDYAIDDSYPHDGVTPPGMGWDGQSDGGGKFRLKRRRRCGQCGPCQVKENCNKCQYCMRKDVLKQACVYRKCVYLRKPVPRFRQEPTSVGSAAHKSAPTPPHKPTSTPVPSAPPSAANSSTTNSSNSAVTNSGTTSNHSTTPVPNPGISSPNSEEVPVSHNAEFSSCRLKQSPFATMSAMQSVNNGGLDPLRHRMMEQPHRSLFESMNHHTGLDPTRAGLDPTKPAMADMPRFTAGTAPPSLNSHCKLDPAATAASHTSSMNTAAVSSLSSMNSALGSHHPHHQPSKCPPSLPPRDPCYPSMDTWSSMPYALPHASAWATPALPSHHVAAATYGFPQHPAPFPSSFSPSSCQLGMSDPTAPRFVSPGGPQHSFHHSMAMAGFSQDFPHAASNHASHANIRAPMNPSFYPPSPHISPSSIHSFPGLGQFSASQASFAPAAYSMHPHAHMYPGSFYSFRAATEPQIYHVEVYPHQNPFQHSLQLLPLICQRSKGLDTKCGNSEFRISGENDKACDIFKRLCLGTCSSDQRRTNSPEKDLVLAYSFKLVKVLRAENLKSYILNGSIAQLSCLACKLDSPNDRHELSTCSNLKVVDESNNRSKIVLLKNTACGSQDAPLENDANNVLDDGDNGSSCSESFPRSGRPDLDLRNLTWIYFNLACDGFSREDSRLSTTLCGETWLLGSTAAIDVSPELCPDLFPLLLISYMQNISVVIIIIIVCRFDKGSLQLKAHLHIHLHFY